MIKKEIQINKKLFINNLYIGTSGNSYFKAAVGGKLQRKAKINEQNSHNTYLE